MGKGDSTVMVWVMFSWFQIYHETKKFGKVFNIKVVCAYGGGSMWEQQKACQEGAEIIVATPVSKYLSLIVSFTDASQFIARKPVKITCSVIHSVYHFIFASSLFQFDIASLFSEIISRGVFLYEPRPEKTCLQRCVTR